MSTPRRRWATARSAVVAAAIGALAITSLAGASAALPSASASPSSPSSPASASEGHTACVPWPKPTSSGLKCTGTYSGNTAWNPWTRKNISERPVVTVSQAKNLYDQHIKVSWSDFTPTIGNSYYEPNPTTDTDPSTWTGQADFHVEARTPTSNGGFFNCSSTEPCSLVIDPNWGGKPGDCSSHPPGGGLPFNGHNSGPEQGDFIGNAGLSGHSGYAEPYSFTTPAEGNSPAAPASLTPANTTPGNGTSPGDYACWTADRIVIPLSFAPTPAHCPQRTPEFYAQGSPMMQIQMLQWQAAWCTGQAPVTLNYTPTSESLAREDFLAGRHAGGARIDMALVTLPATAAQQQASHRRFTYAPLANSGTGFAYYVDDGKTGTQINRMVLDARLLAKLITQSYTLAYGCTPADHTKPSLTCDPAVWGTGKNAYSLYDDPEFLSLNRHCQPYGQPATYTCGNASNGTDQATDDFPANSTSNASTAFGAFLPTVLEPDSDMTYDLTGWIAANPDAAAFLNGTPDPSGMHVNTNYLHVSYPAQAFAVLDHGYTLPITCSTTGCPVGVRDVTMQATWNPQPDLDTIALDLLTNQPTAAEPIDTCPVPSGCTKASQLVPTSAMPPQLPGSSDLLSEMDLGDIANYLFPAADLVNGAGNAVGPTQASVEAAVSVMKTNHDGITQHFPFTSTDPAAYPLAMVDYAMVPTCGLSHAEALAIADFLTKAATTGQSQGEAPGGLAPGYYPLTAKQKAQTLKAAWQVRAQTCTSPPPDHTISGS